MKIGILTFHRGLNHGGFLQAYCMVLAVKELGLEPEIINYKNEVHHSKDSFNPWIYRNLYKLIFNWKKNRAFKRAFKKMPLTKFTTDSSEVNWGDYDAILIGSDIVWNYELASLGHDEFYFGGLPDEFKGKIISYAPSCGEMNFDYAVPDSIVKFMTRFSAVSARDANTQKYAEKHTDHKNVPIVVDPTWLTQKDRGLSRYKNKKESYILIYGYNIPDDYGLEIKKFSKEKGLKIIGTGYYQSIADEQFSSADPFEWVDLVSNASYVIAGTFHAALYAIRESVNFAVIPQPAINTKLKGPLNITDLHSHIVHEAGDLEKVLNMKLDKKLVDSKISVSREQSMKYLKDSLLSDSY